MELKNKKRILVIGGSGSGKSTFAKILGRKLKIEVIHLDRYFWRPNWVKKNDDDFKEIVSRLILKDEWIMEGNYSKTLSIRIPRTDHIFFFDFPSYFNVYRILKRSFKTKLGLEKRTDLAEGCEEKWFDWEFVKFVWNFKNDYIPLNYMALEELNFDKTKLRIFYNSKDVKKYLNSLQ